MGRGRLANADGILNHEGEPRLRWDADLLPLGEDFGSGARCGSRTGANRSAFSVAGHRADQRSQRRPAAGRLGGAVPREELSSVTV